MGRKSDQDGLQIEPEIRRINGKLEGWNFEIWNIGNVEYWKDGLRSEKNSFLSLFHYSIIPVSIFQHSMNLVSK